MIKKSEKWTARCDGENCNKEFETMGKVYSASFECSLVADLKTSGWVIKSKRCFCSNCKAEGKVK